MHDDVEIPAGGRIEPTAFSDALSERYLAYALSTITSRSLPDVRAVSYTHLTLPTIYSV